MAEETQRPRRNPVHRVLRFIGGAFKAYFISIGVLVTVMPFLIFFVVQRVSVSEPKAKAQIAAGEKIIVKVDLTGELVEESQDVTKTFIQRLFGEDYIVDVSDVESMLRRAAMDKRVKGVIVDLNALRGSSAAYASLRSSFARFKESKKPLVVHMSSANTNDYYLASIGDEISVAESASLETIGPVFQLVYVGNGLKKLGIDFEVIRTGRYKSAFEPFVTNAPSDATKEMYNSMEESLRGHLIEAIAAARQKNPQEVKTWLARGFYTPPEAVEAGMINTISYYPTAEEEFKKKVGAETVMKSSDYLDASGNVDEPFVDYTGDKVALIEAVGTIYGDEALGTQEAITPRPLIKQLKWAAKEDDIKAVVFRISSPGGSALASDLIWDEVRKLAAKKPVVVSMGDVAASGGYYISAPATKIFAEPSTLTGSIGVIAAMPKGKSLEEKYGVSFFTITQSNRRRLLNFSDTPSEEDKKLLGGQVDYTYDLFLRKVAEGRKIPIERVKELAEGRVYTGMQAKELGLVDGLGGLREAFQEAKKLGKLDPNKLYPIAQHQGVRFNIFECFNNPLTMMQCLNKGDKDSSVFSSLLQQTLTPAQTLERLAHQDPLLAVWPGAYFTRMARP